MRPVPGAERVLWVGQAQTWVSLFWLDQSQVIRGFLSAKSLHLDITLLVSSESSTPFAVEKWGFPKGSDTRESPESARLSVGSGAVMCERQWRTRSQDLTYGFDSWWCERGGLAGRGKQRTKMVLRGKGLLLIPFFSVLGIKTGLLIC